MFQFFTYTRHIVRITAADCRTFLDGFVSQLTNCGVLEQVNNCQVCAELLIYAAYKVYALKRISADLKEPVIVCKRIYLQRLYPYIAHLLRSRRSAARNCRCIYLFRQNSALAVCAETARACVYIYRL